MGCQAPKSRFGSAPISTKRGRVSRLPLVTAIIPSAVIPAKAGVHSANRRKCAMDGLDSRFRGNDFLHSPPTENQLPTSDISTFLWTIYRFRRGNERKRFFKNGRTKRGCL